MFKFHSRMISAFLSFITLLHYYAGQIAILIARWASRVLDGPSHVVNGYWHLADRPDRPAPADQAHFIVAHVPPPNAGGLGSGIQCVIQSSLILGGA